MENHGGSSSNSGGETRREQEPPSRPVRIYTCPYCSKTFHTSQAFAGHHNMHRDDEITSAEAHMNVPIYVTPISFRPPLHEPFVPGSLFGVSQGTSTWFRPPASGTALGVPEPSMFPNIICPPTMDRRSVFEIGSGSSGQPPSPVRPIIDVWNMERIPDESSEKTTTCPEIRNMVVERGMEVTSAEELDLTLKL